MHHCKNILKNIWIEGSAARGLRVLPCCFYITDNDYRTIEDWYASEEYQSIKTAESWPVGCSTCKRQEELNEKSYRQIANEALENTTGRRFEIFPSNVCNLKCVMCHARNSSALANEQHSLGIISNQFNKEIDLGADAINIINKYDDIDSISLMGGEFFLAKGNIEIIELAISKNIPVRAVTNATVITPKHLEKLKQAGDLLKLQLSCDGIHEYYELIRYPAKWNTFLNNAKRLIAELPKAKINFHFVAQPLNAKNLVPSLAFFNTLKIPTRVTSIAVPEYMTWSMLTDSEREKIIATITEQLDQLDQYRLTSRQIKQVKDLVYNISKSEYSDQQREKFNFAVGKTMQHRGVDLVVAVGLEPTIDTV